MNHLIDHIYIGNAEDAKDRDLLRSFGIGVIINLTEVPGPVFDGLEYIQLNQPDNVPVPGAKIELFFGFLQSQSDHKPLLIHCAAGISRTAAFTAALLVRRYGMGWEEAFSLIKEKRACCNPSPVLVESLRRHFGDFPS